MVIRDWTDPRDGRHWKVRQTGLPTVLVFASEDDVVNVLVDFRDSLRGSVGRGPAAVAG